MVENLNVMSDESVKRISKHDAFIRYLTDYDAHDFAKEPA